MNGEVMPEGGAHASPPPPQGALYSQIEALIRQQTRCSEQTAANTAERITEAIKQAASKYPDVSLPRLLAKPATEEDRLLESLLVTVNSLGVEQLTESLKHCSSIPELVSKLQDHLSLLLTHVSNTELPSSLLPFVDYLCLYVCGVCDNAKSTQHEFETCNQILGILLEVILLKESVAEHMGKNSRFFQAIFERRSEKNCVIMCTFLLMRSCLLARTLDPSDCQRLLCDLSTCSDDMSSPLLNLLLALNLGYIHPAQNPILRAIITLNAHEVTDLMLAEVIALFNRRVDPLAPFRRHDDTDRSSSVLKMMMDLFSSRPAVKLIYTNDLKVIFDVLLGSITDMTPGSQDRVDSLSLLDLAIRNVPFLRDTKYKLPLFVQLLQPISDCSDGCLEEALIARSCLANLNCK